MFDDLYSRLVERVSYKTLIFVPVVLSVFLLLLIYVKGVPLGLDFNGGTLIRITSEEAVSPDKVDAIREELIAEGFQNLEIIQGKEIGSSNNIITISTTTFVENETRIGKIKIILENYLGELSQKDTVTVKTERSPPKDLDKKLESRLNQKVDVEFDEEDSILRIIAFDINTERLERALEFYLEGDISMKIKKKNMNMNRVDPTLGKDFMDQGLQALIYSCLLMVTVIFLAFRDPIPSLAVILAAAFDCIFAVGGMSLFNILLEPPSLVAVLMLMGYSVDSDILLTTRVMRSKRGAVDERIDNAMKTGLTMTGTTMAVMIVIIILSNTLLKIEVIPDIAAVLLIGLVGDLISTWFMNAGILKWYMGEKGGKFQFWKSRKKKWK
ncbi:MAG: hypothetical protein KAU03_01815 [Candidatus Altiarchaeales archaeon]|nr:hypothetical protein [Candidatus Altiarchaeales archaeon]